MNNYALRRVLIGATIVIAIVTSALLALTHRHVEPPRTLVVLVDASSGFGHISDAVQLTIDLAARLRPQDRLVVYSFAGTPQFVYDGPVGDLDSLAETIGNAFKTQPPPGTRPLLAVTEASSVSAPHVSIVILSDGDNDFEADAAALNIAGAKLASRPNVTIGAAFVSPQNALALRSWFAGRVAVSTDPLPSASQIAKSLDLPH